MTSSSARPGPARRRQRSTRLLVSALLLALAAAAVVVAVVAGSWAVAAGVAVVVLLLGAVATRITYAEVVASRREAAGDRARQAQDYLALTQVRTAEQAMYVTETQGRLALQGRQIVRLETALQCAVGELHEARDAVEAERRRADAECERAEAALDGQRRLQARIDDAEERAAQAVVRVAELEQELDVVLSEWRAGGHLPMRKHA